MCEINMRTAFNQLAKTSEFVWVDYPDRSPRHVYDLARRRLEIVRAVLQTARFFDHSRGLMYQWWSLCDNVAELISERDFVRDLIDQYIDDNGGEYNMRAINHAYSELERDRDTLRLEIAAEAVVNGFRAISAIAAGVAAQLK